MIREGSVENHEINSTPTFTLNSEEFLDRIYQGQSLPQDKRFSSENCEGVFKYFQLRYLLDRHRSHEQYYSIIESENEIAGIACLEVNPENKENLWIQLVSIDPKYHDQKLSRKLLSEVYKFAKENNYNLEASSYSEDGHKKLKPLLQELSTQFDVRFIDNDRKI